jgi:hypothetical protein
LAWVTIKLSSILIELKTLDKLFSLSKSLVSNQEKSDHINNKLIELVQGQNTSVISEYPSLGYIFIKYRRENASQNFSS